MQLTAIQARDDTATEISVRKPADRLRLLLYVALLWGIANTVAVVVIGIKAYDSTDTASSSSSSSSGPVDSGAFNALVARTTSIETNQTIMSRPMFNNVPQFAVLKVYGYWHQAEAAYIPLNDTMQTVTLPDLFNESTIMIDAEYDASLRTMPMYPLTRYGIGDTASGAYFLSTNLQWLCGYRPGDAAFPSQFCRYGDMTECATVNDLMFDLLYPETSFPAAISVVVSLSVDACLAA